MYKALVILLWVNYAFGGENSGHHHDHDFEYHSEDPAEEGYGSDGARLEEIARHGINFTEDPDKAWVKTDGLDYILIPYKVCFSFPNEYYYYILDVIAFWNKTVPFIQWSWRDDQTDWVNFWQGNGCNAPVGRRGGEQSISIPRTKGCVHKRGILRFMMHTIGLADEHERQDRDEYIEVLWDNLDKVGKSSYSKPPASWYSIYGDYDYYSFMHNNKTAYTIGDQPAFKVLKPGVNIDEVGMSETFTDLDMYKMKKLYNID